MSLCPASTVTKLAFGGRSVKFVTLFQVLTPSIVLYICPVLLPDQTTPCLTIESEKSEIDAAATPRPPAGAAGVGAPGVGAGAAARGAVAGAGATPHGTIG